MSLDKSNIGVYTNPNHDLWVAEALPTREEAVSGSTLKEGEVSVVIRSTGICGSDVHFWHAGCIGPMIVTDDHILGHESAGEIIAVGPNVKNVKVGDRVSLEPQQICNSCEACLTGRYNGCPDVAFLSTPPVPGLLRRYLIHQAKFCFKLGDNMSYEEGAMLEPLSVALAAVERSGLKLGDCALVTGAGPIGIITLLCLKAAGATPVVIADIDEHRLEFAKSLHPDVITYQVPRGKAPEDCAADILNLLNNGDGANPHALRPKVSIECTGVESCVNTAIWCAPFGGKVFVTGCGKNEIQIPFMRLSTMEIDLQYQYRYCNTWPRAIRLVNAGLIDLKPLVTHRFPIEDAVKAFETAANPKTGAIKVQITNM
ncbi:L-arabinitol 4-dehydrogenase [Ascosphaera aggregata]|nr:L-arabinitol 4-dehydrogenase [Ascosphaera aggregata]